MILEAWSFKVNLRKDSQIPEVWNNGFKSCKVNISKRRFAIHDAKRHCGQRTQDHRFWPVYCTSQPNSEYCKTTDVTIIIFLSPVVDNDTLQIWGVNFNRSTTSGSCQNIKYGNTDPPGTSYKYHDRNVAEFGINFLKLIVMKSVSVYIHDFSVTSYPKSYFKNSCVVALSEAFTSSNISNCSLLMVSDLWLVFCVQYSNSWKKGVSVIMLLSILLKKKQGMSSTLNY